MDVDRDANIKLEGQAAAGSLDRGEGTSPRFSSSIKGLGLLADLLDEMGIPATFFCEGRTLEEMRDSAGILDGFEIGVHGYDHEFLPGMIRPDAISAVEHGCQAIRDVTGRNPTCFRAPYMKQPRDIADFLKNTGIRVDSSTYAQADRCIPSMLPGYVVEIPVTEGRDINGKSVSAYLWPMHEGKRNPLDYSDLAGCVPEEGCFVLADHSWHICELRERGVLSEEDVKENLELERRALQGILDAGLEPMTISDASRLASPY
ncbi:putative xylanase/chitin deacetylase [Thermoplasmatales archaeon BRNA1]|nr:putative xylanase/chitin deacetylase [Thermoplasmatales archaeon BRNA1]